MKYRHLKTGGEYQVLLRRVAFAPLFAQEQVHLTDDDPVTALVTDDIHVGEEIVFYENTRGGRFARPAWMFDDGRFQTIP